MSVPKRTGAKRPIRTSAERSGKGGSAAGARALSTRSRLWWVLGAGAVVVIFVVLVVVSAQRSSSQRAKASGTAVASSSAGASAAGTLPRFTMADVDGRTVTRPGGKPGLLIFTASYCTPCIEQAPGIVALKRRLGARVEILTFSIDPGDSAAAMRSAFGPIAGRTPGYVLGWDSSGRLAPAYGVSSLGTEVVYDRRGRQVWRGVLSDSSEIAAALRRAGA